MKLKKYMLWVIGALMSLFLILFILAISNVISYSLMIGTVISITIVGIITWGSIIFINKQDEDDINISKVKVIGKKRAKELANNALLEIEVLEYASETFEDDIRNEGEKDTPIYVYTIRGLYEGKIINILVNMENENISIKFYNDVEIKLDDINKNISERSNILSQSPIRHNLRTTELVNPLTQMKSVVKEEIERNRSKSETNEGDGAFG